MRRSEQMVFGRLHEPVPLCRAEIVDRDGTVVVTVNHSTRSRPLTRGRVDETEIPRSAGPGRAVAWSWPRVGTSSGHVTTLPG